PAPAPGASASPAVAPTAAPAAAAVADTEERRVEGSTADLGVAFNNRGARLISWELKRFVDREGHPEELVQTLKDAPPPLDIEPGDAELDARLKDALFLPSAPVVTVAPGESGELRLRYAAGDVEAEKAFRFPGRGYLVEVR